MTPHKVPAADRSAKGEWLQITPGERFTIRTSCQETDGRCCVLEIVAQPGNGVPLHVHDCEDEHFIVLDGTLRIANGATTVDLPAGSAVTVQRGVPHAWCNRADRPVRMLVVFSPGRIEGLFRSIVDGMAVDPGALAARYGTRFIGPPLHEGIFTIVAPRGGLDAHASR